MVGKTFHFLPVIYGGVVVISVIVCNYITETRSFVITISCG